MAKELLDLHDVAGLAGVCKRTVERWIEQGRLQVTNLNAGMVNKKGLPMKATLRVRRSDFYRFVDQQQEKTAKEMPCHAKS